MKKPERKTGSELEVGDVLSTWCGSKSITSFDEHPGVPNHYPEVFPGVDIFPARVANSGKWGMTILDGDVFRLTADGEYSLH